MPPYHEAFPVRIPLPEKNLFKRRIEAIECLSIIDKSSTKARKSRPLPRLPRHQRLWSNPLDGTIRMNTNSRPLFGQWFKQTWLDLLTMVLLGALGLTLFFVDPIQPRMFPIWDSNGEVIWPQFAYPITKEHLPIWLVVLLVTTIPVAVILLCQIRIRSFWDTNNALMGLMYSLITAAVFQVFLKWLIGGLRPQFYSVCQPDPSKVAPDHEGVIYTRGVCSGKARDVNKALASFPSGHATSAFAGFVFLSLYLNAKFKVFANYQPKMWKLVLVFAPVLAATLMAAEMVADYSHNWYDVVAGAIIGIAMAFSSFRVMYASIWDFRTNHIVLLPNVANDDVQQLLGPEHITQAVCTRKVGWGPSKGKETSTVQKAPETPAMAKDGPEKVDLRSNNGSSIALGHNTPAASSFRGPPTGRSAGGAEMRKVEETV